MNLLDKIWLAGIVVAILFGLYEYSAWKRRRKQREQQWWW